MRNATLTAPLFAALLLAGCGGALTPTLSGAAKAPAPNAPDTCNAAAYQTLIGSDAAQALSLPEPKRLVGPDDAVTSDFQPNRLNVALDDTDTIVGVTCG
ncbi:I78 family peptidase inhibitor [Sulfitobacter sp. HNIBRBA2951]|uniref:I78 family peptidase inhibitor n=1 Tax=Sulfitobacter aquimarinus TaxID=3158557 RepID=UPI0032DE794C